MLNIFARIYLSDLVVYLYHWKKYFQRSPDLKFSTQSPIWRNNNKYIINPIYVAPCAQFQRELIILHNCLQVLLAGIEQFINDTSALYRPFSAIHNNSSVATMSKC